MQRTLSRRHQYKVADFDSYRQWLRWTSLCRVFEGSVALSGCKGGRKIWVSVISKKMLFLGRGFGTDRQNRCRVMRATTAKYGRRSEKSEDSFTCVFVHPASRSGIVKEPNPQLWSQMAFFQVMWNPAPDYFFTRHAGALLPSKTGWARLEHLWSFSK